MLQQALEGFVAERGGGDGVVEREAEEEEVVERLEAGGGRRVDFEPFAEELAGSRRAADSAALAPNAACAVVGL